MKKKTKNFGYFFIVIIFFFFINFVFFSFSYISLINNQVYDWFWVKNIQKTLYFKGGLRNIWQANHDCIEFDEELLYVPRDGVCQFDNAEFKTKLTFRNGVRNNANNLKNLSDDLGIAVLGDSFSMGWGVNDNETYSSILERLLKKKVYNLGVSSYGTIREIKKIKKNKIYNKVDTIIIQYDPNDYIENIQLNFKKKYTYQEYKILAPNQQQTKDKFFFFLRYSKKSFRILYHDIIKYFSPDRYVDKINLSNHFEVLKKIIFENLDYKNKKIIILFPENLDIKYYNLPESVDYLDLINLDMKSNKSNFFIIDDHWTAKGHKYAAQNIYKFLIKKN